MTPIQFLNTRTGDRSPRNEPHEPFDAGKLFRFERTEFGSDLAFLLERQATPIPTVIYASKTPIKRRIAEQKTRAQHVAETRKAYLAALNTSDWLPMQELCDKLGKSRATVSERMKMLVASGCVMRKETRTAKARTAYTTVFYKLAKSTNSPKD